MDYNNGNNNMNMGNQGMPNPGMPYPGMPNQGMPGQGMPPQGMPGPGMPNQGMPYRGMPGQGMPPQGMPNPGIPNQGIPNQGMPGQGMPNRGMPGPGTPYPGAPGQGMRPPMTDRNKPSQADIASSRLAREIEKSVKGEGRNEKPDMTPNLTSGLKRAGGKPPVRMPALAVPSGLIEGISGFSAYIFGGILVLCLIISLAAYGKDHKGGSVGGKKASIPSDMITYTGIFRNAYEAAASGSLNSGGVQSGALYDDDGTLVPAAPTAIGEETAAATDTEGSDTAGQSSSDDSGTSESSESSGSSGSYGKAESYKELLDQLEKAIASGDSDFVSSKMAYEDESGTLKAFPQTVVDHFVTYMSSNSDKRTSLMTDLSSDKYSGQSNGEFIVKLPYIKFVVNMGYDNTTISLPGFSDQVVNAGQSADIAPLMPCMYTLTISNPDWNDVVTRDIEANINESTISINIKP